MGTEHKKYNYERAQRPLTEEEKLVVEKNHNLIYSYARLHHLQIDNINIIVHSHTTHENWYGVLAQALCYAVKTWDEGKGSLSNWAYCAMETAVKHTKEKYKIHNPTIMGSLEAFGDSTRSQRRNGADDDINDTLYNLGAMDEMIEEGFGDVEIRTILEAEYKKMGKYGELCRQVLEYGAEISKMAKKLGVTRQMGWYEYDKVFLPRLRAELQTALNIN